MAPSDEGAVRYVRLMALYLYHIQIQPSDMCA